MCSYLSRAVRFDLHYSTWSLSFNSKAETMSRVFIYGNSSGCCPFTPSRKHWQRALKRIITTNHGRIILIASSILPINKFCYILRWGLIPGFYYSTLVYLIRFESGLKLNLVVPLKYRHKWKQSQSFQCCASNGWFVCNHWDRDVHTLENFLIGSEMMKIIE